MLVKRSSFVVVTFVMMITLLVLTDDSILSGVITFTVIMVGYIIISIKRSKKRLGLLNEKCDPEAFLERTEKQMEITGKNAKLQAYLNVDKAAALVCMGEYQEGKNLLLSIDKSKLSTKNGTLLVFTINLICCLYELGEIAEAEGIFERELFNITLDSVPITKAPFKRAIKFLNAERDYILGKYEESQTAFEELLNEKSDKRTHVSALYGLAKIHEKLGEVEKAKEMYKEVSEEGNKLYIAKVAKRKVEEMD
ncbi:tetratricopeptide repeat protein [Oceanirhabdus seepicola]|uniref:Tetratricopeptide repeat protein n=1 Tax=Oceanirhabdus seepicola TaxID=2828781 RepID=A0A9J6P373_9CLOT|nr:tetratricopeptide repeat protein [Oceanirhabdus seepicola]MCM1991210.1 tetratricopeptide repeat protein [Oceanirhabdus seepicola]